MGVDLIIYDNMKHGPDMTRAYQKMVLVPYDVRDDGNFLLRPEEPSQEKILSLNGREQLVLTGPWKYDDESLMWDWVNQRMIQRNLPSNMAEIFAVGHKRLTSGKVFAIGRYYGREKKS